MLKSKVWLLLGVLIIGLLGWVWGPDLVKVFDLRRQEQALETKIGRLEAANAELRTRIEELENDPVALEFEARRKLGVTRSKEVVYKIIEESDVRRNLR